MLLKPFTIAAARAVRRCEDETGFPGRSANRQPNGEDSVATAQAGTVVVPDLAAAQWVFHGNFTDPVQPEVWMWLFSTPAPPPALDPPC